MNRYRTKSFVMAVVLALGSCGTRPLVPFSVDTPPLALVPAAQAGVQDKRGRFREIYCAVLEARKSDVPDYRPCEDALSRIGSEPPGTGRPVDLGPSKRRLVGAVVAGIGYECFEKWLQSPGTTVQHRSTPSRQPCSVRASHNNFRSAIACWGASPSFVPESSQMRARASDL